MYWLSITDVGGSGRFGEITARIERGYWLGAKKLFWYRLRSRTTAPCARGEEGGSLSEIYNLFTSIHRLSTCLFFHINLPCANSCLRISYISPPAFIIFYQIIFYYIFFLSWKHQFGELWFLCLSCSCWGINLSHKSYTTYMRPKKKRLPKPEVKKEGIYKLRTSMSGNPTGILAVFALLLLSSVVSIPVHYRPFHALFFYSKALQTFPTFPPDSCALVHLVAIWAKQTNKHHSSSHWLNFFFDV